MPRPFGGDTIYLCVVDAQGMAVSLNQSLFLAFGSGVVVPGTGVLLHNRGAYFTPATYRGGARPIHTLAPAMALADGRPRLVFGTMGGEAQVQIHLQLLARILVAGQRPMTRSPRRAGPSIARCCCVEDGLRARGAARDVGWDTLRVPELAGHAHAILVAPDGLDAGCDPRSDGQCAGRLSVAG